MVLTMNSNYKDIELKNSNYVISGTNPIAVPIDAKGKILYLVSQKEPVIPNPAEFSEPNFIPNTPIIPEAPSNDKIEDTAVINPFGNTPDESNFSVNKPVENKNSESMIKSTSQNVNINQTGTMKTLDIPDNLAALSDDELVRTLEDAKTLVEECIIPTMNIVSSELGKYILLAKEQKERQQSQIELYNKGQEAINNNINMDNTFNPFKKAA